MHQKWRIMPTVSKMKDDDGLSPKVWTEEEIKPKPTFFFE